MIRRTKIGCAGAVVGLLMVPCVAARLQAQDDGWKRLTVSTQSAQKLQPGDAPIGMWRLVRADVEGRRAADAEQTRSDTIVWLPTRRGTRVAAQLGRLHAFRSPRRAHSARMQESRNTRRRLPDPASPVRHADADWDTLETDPPAATAQPDPIVPLPEPITPAPAPIEPSPRAEPIEAYLSKDIRNINPSDIVPDGQSVLPEIVPVPSFPARVVDNEIELFHWEATAVRNYPLYFEDMPLERYGHSLGCLQPLWSTGQFYAQVLLWPYEMGLDPPHKPLYALGYYRPGDCVERLWYQIPVNKAAVLSQAAAFTLFPVVFP